MTFASGDLLWSYRYTGHWIWESHRIAKVTSARIFLEPPDPKRTTKRVVLSRAALEQAGKAHSSGFGRWIFTAAERVHEEARLRIRDREVEELRRLFEANRGRPFHEWRSLVDAHPGDPHSWPATGAEIRRKFRQLAATAHPDAGGSHEEFIILERSYRRALQMAGAA